MSFQNIVILTGAGISAESGLVTFRDNDGLWCNHRIEDVATPEAFARNPLLVHDFYNQRRAQLKDAKPNAAHLALAKLASQPGKRVTIVTQNVDDLHEKAHFLHCHPALVVGSVVQQGRTPQQVRGDNYILHMHGELKKIRCDVTEEVVDWEDELGLSTICSCCKKSGRLRPHIVWFGEMPLHMEAIAHLLHGCDLFISIGTSGNVYPAAGFVHEVRNLGRAHTVEINMEPSMGYSLFAEKIYGPATQKVPEFVETLLG